jgi:hypothetical protein
MDEKALKENFDAWHKLTEKELKAVYACWFKHAVPKGYGKKDLSTHFSNEGYLFSKYESVVKKLIAKGQTLLSEWDEEEELKQDALLLVSPEGAKPLEVKEEKKALNDEETSSLMARQLQELQSQIKTLRRDKDGHVLPSQIADLYDSKISKVKKVTKKKRMAWLKGIPKYEKYIPKPVTSDPVQVTKKFRSKEVLDFVTNTLPHLHRQTFDVYRLMLHVHETILDAETDELIATDVANYLQDMTNIACKLCLDTGAGIYNKQRTLTAKQLGHSEIIGIRQDEEDDETEVLFDTDDVKAIRDHQNFQWDLRRTTNRDSRGGGGGRKSGGFGRPWKSSFNNNNGNSFGNNNSNFSRYGRGGGNNYNSNRGSSSYGSRGNNNNFSSRRGSSRGRRGRF